MPDQVRVFILQGRSQWAVHPLVGVDSAGSFHLIGTAFFIASGGFIATAAHVLDEAARYAEAGILQLTEDHGEYRSIETYSNHQISDVGIARLETPHDDCSTCADHPVLSIMRLAPEINEFCGTFAYPRTEIQPPEVRGDGLVYQRFNVTATVHMGEATELHPGGLGIVRGPCYRTTIDLEGACSGGPTFNSNGFVCAINSSGWDGGPPDSTVSAITDILDLTIDGPAGPTRAEDLIRNTWADQRRPPNASLMWLDVQDS